jgi:uncharacterized CHY-type Zn-finger protein
MTKCERCHKEYNESPFQRTSRAIMESAALCPECMKLWLVVRKERKLSNIRYIKTGEAIDW